MKKVRNLNGYKLVYEPDHPRAMKSENWKGWIYEHIMIAEKAVGRSLRDNEVVHHLDCDRANNRQANLLILDRGQHSKLHHWLDAGAPICESFGMNRMNSGKSKKSKKSADCAVCGKSLPRDQEKYCSTKCAGIANERVERPSKEELAKLIEESNFCAIGRKYGVSDNAVRKWAKKYGIL